MQETARSIIDNFEGDHDSEQMTSPMTSSPPGGSTRADKAADKWSMAFCEFYRDNWVGTLFKNFVISVVKMKYMWINIETFVLSSCCFYHLWHHLWHHHHLGAALGLTRQQTSGLWPSVSSTEFYRDNWVGTLFKNFVLVIVTMDWFIWFLMTSIGWYKHSVIYGILVVLMKCYCYP